MWNDTLLKQLKTDLAFIENAENYYAMFGYVIERCATARQANILLSVERVISNEIYVENDARIRAARKSAIITHGEWTIKMFEQSKTQHTPRTFVSSVYSDIFDVELKGEKK